MDPLVPIKNLGSLPKSHNTRCSTLKIAAILKETCLFNKKLQSPPYSKKIFPKNLVKINTPEMIPILSLNDPYAL